MLPTVLVDDEKPIDLTINLTILDDRTESLCSKAYFKSLAKKSSFLIIPLCYKQITMLCAIRLTKSNNRTAFTLVVFWDFGNITNLTKKKIVERVYISSGEDTSF